MNRLKFHKIMTFRTPFPLIYVNSYLGSFTLLISPGNPPKMLHLTGNSIILFL